MIVKLTKKIQECKIGIIGFRSTIIEKVLDKYNLDYIKISDESLVDVDYFDSTKFDFVLGSGVHSIIGCDIIDKVKFGIFMIHETPLPEGRGSAPLQWTVKNKKDNLTCTLFKINSGIDNGMIVYQHNIPVNIHDTLVNLEEKRSEGIFQCYDILISELLAGYITLRKQSGKGSYSKKRTPADSNLDATQKLADLWDDIRICDNEKFPAHFYVDGKKIILRYEVEHDNS